MPPLVRVRDGVVALVVAALFWTGLLPVWQRPAAPAAAVGAPAAATLLLQQQREAPAADAGLSIMSSSALTAASSASALAALDVKGGDRLVLYRKHQPYYHSTQLPHDWIVVKSQTTPAFFQIIGDPQVDQTMSSMLWDGWYEPEVTGLVLHIMRTRCSPATSAVVDVGCNLGWFTLVAAAHGYNVSAFDTQARVVKLLRQSIILNGFQPLVHLHHGPVGPDGASVRISDVTSNWGGVSVNIVDGGGGGGGGHADGSTMTTIALDTALAAPVPQQRADASICFLKIDVEGFELDVLQAAAATLRRTRHVVMEYRDNSRGERILELLRDAGLTHMMIITPRCCTDADSAAPFLHSPDVVTSVAELRAQISRLVPSPEHVNLVLFRV